MPILTWPDKFGARSLLEHSQHFPSSVHDRTPPAAGVALDVTVAARVNAGRWIADCPTPDCHGAEYVDPGALMFFCCECRNAPTAHQPIRVAMPADRLRGQIEKALLERPVPATRNWRTGETVAQLRAENKAHGVN